jgi:replicative DNA helicase
MGRVAEAVGVIAETPIFSDETPAIGVIQLRSRARRLKADGLDVAHHRLPAVDDARPTSRQRGRCKSTSSRRAEGVREGTEDSDLLLVATLARARQTRRAAAPLGSEVQRLDRADADIVMFLYHKEDPEQLPNGGTLTELIVAKHRNGPTGTIKLSLVRAVHAVRPTTAKCQPNRKTCGCRWGIGEEDSRGGSLLRRRRRVDRLHPRVRAARHRLRAAGHQPLADGGRHAQR